jgi:hypothetical protein
MLDFEYKISEMIIKIGNNLELLSINDLNKKNNSRVFKLSKDELISEFISKLVDLLEELKEKNETELINICNQYNIDFENSSNKESLLLSILNHLQLKQQCYLY